MRIKDVKFSYLDRKYGLVAELDVASPDYDSIVSAIQDRHPEYEQVKVMSFRKK